MHELALAQSILEICEEEARKQQAGAIQKIKLRLGDFSGVVREALEFSFDALKAETLAAGAGLEIERVPLEVRCPRCGQVSSPPASDLCFVCTDCGSPVEITSGRELQVEYIEVE